MQPGASSEGTKSSLYWSSLHPKPGFGTLATSAAQLQMEDSLDPALLFTHPRRTSSYFAPSIRTFYLFVAPTSPSQPSRNSQKFLMPRNFSFSAPLDLYTHFPDTHLGDIFPGLCQEISRLKLPSCRRYTAAFFSAALRNVESLLYEKLRTEPAFEQSMLALPPRSAHCPYGLLPRPPTVID